ncbi:MAG: ribosome small subunit-dependent GTPase A, partial [Candidatus Wallbacteria bacterium]|nr:ribosome small subunit-dependent GTPase A [Candidatus Wallbacteria bacterium]
MDLSTLGWTPELQSAFARRWPGELTPARVASVHGGSFDVVGGDGRLLAELAGRLKQDEEGERPAAGDWVALAPRPAEGRGTIHGIVPRRTKLSRKVAGGV